MASARGWSEDRLHRWLAEQPWPARLEGSRGHDAAVLRSFGGRPVLCADQCVEGVHFAPGAPAGLVGSKAVLRTLSDLAATAATPRAVTLTLAARVDVAEEWIQGCLTGAQAAAARCGVELVAGDLSRTSGALAVSVTALGSLEGERSPVGRDRAEAGQVVLLTGPVGGSLPSGRHLAPTPRFAEGRELWLRLGATAMMDVSDGLAWDLHRLARASGVSIRLEGQSVPIHPDAQAASSASGRTPLDHALHDGEDHELIATVPRARSAEAVASGFTVIGECEVGAGLTLVDADGARPWAPGTGGWTHGSDE